MENNRYFTKACIEMRAKKEYGTTEVFEFAGWLLKDGDMLNFSHEGYQRDDDHRSIAQFFSKVQGTEALYKFMRRGNIRCNCNASGFCFEFDKLPTKEQFDCLYEAWRQAERYDVPFIIEKGETGRSYNVYTFREFCNHLYRYVKYNLPMGMIDIAA